MYEFYLALFPATSQYQYNIKRQYILRHENETDRLRESKTRKRKKKLPSDLDYVGGLLQFRFLLHIRLGRAT